MAGLVRGVVLARFPDDGGSSADLGSGVTAISFFLMSVLGVDGPVEVA